VCQQVIIVDRGQMLGVGRISELCQVQRGKYRLCWRGDATGFLNQLRADGLTITAAGRSDQAIVSVPNDWTTRRFFERSVEHDVTLREVIPEEEDLKQVYRRLVMPAAQ